MECYVCLQAQAVELLCRCDDIPDDGIELRVLKGLLTAVTSNHVHVHGQALLLVSPKMQMSLLYATMYLVLPHCVFHTGCG